ncbi:BA75_00837T0 [Komagataella pastoris]|uniref:BA75_00837T0 n=1 Tax=Komagataella pastoris TaxID=4922 RepID=A0A1B2J6N8_PICPA|nr:BA75_00837T0 [Komagataella pastoris]
MSQGTIYLLLGSPRTALCKDLIEYYGLDIKISDTSDPEFAKTFPLKRVPALQGPDFTLHETLAVLVYITSLIPQNHALFGYSNLDYAQTIKWLSFTNFEVVSTLIQALYPLIGYRPYTKEGVDQALKDLKSYVAVYETQLRQTKYLVGDEITLADLFTVQSFIWGSEYIWDVNWFKQHPLIEAWFKDVIQHPVVVKSLGDFKPVQKAVPNAPPRRT